MMSGVALGDAFWANKQLFGAIFCDQWLDA